MTSDSTAAMWRGAAAEWFLAALVIAGAARSAIRLAIDGYLPQPFFYNPNDTLMDWYYTVYWAREGGAYRIWHSMYPPLAFVWARLFSTPGCYRIPDLAVRDCDTIGAWALIAIWAANGLLAWIAIRRRDPVRALPRAVALAFGLPSLFALDRGQMVTPTMLFFIVAWGALIRRGIPRAMAHAMALNFKPYLLPMLFGLVARRSWAALLLIGWAGLVIYVLCWGLAGGSPVEIIRNYGIFAHLGHAFPVTEVYQATSFNAFASVVAHGVSPTMWKGPGLSAAMLLARHVLAVALGVQLVVHMLLIAAMAGALLRPRALAPTRSALLALLLVYTVTSPGIYALAPIFFLLFLEPGRGVAWGIAVACAYLLSVPFDWIIVPYPVTATPAWLSGRIVEARFGLAVGQLARPAVLLMLATAVAADSLVRVRKHAQHGS